MPHCQKPRRFKERRPRFLRVVQDERDKLHERLLRGVPRGNRPGDGWLRKRFGELGVLEYEDWEDTGAEYERMQLGEPLPA